MFQHSLSSSGRRLGGLALGLTIVGVGFSFAQDRHPARPAPVDRPAPSRSMDRPPARVMPDRPGATSRPPSVRGPVNRAEVPIRPATSAVLIPWSMPRCTARPTPEVWRHRDIMTEIQSMARRGFIAVHPIGEDVSEFTGISYFPAGWISYGFRVPPGESIHVRLHHSNEGWFRLAMVNKWGSLEQGMLQNLIPTGNPEVKYSNPTKEVRSVYVIVDDPGWMSSKDNPFKVNVTRSWDPTQKKVDDAPIVTGIWAQKQEEAKPTPGAQEATAPAQPKG